MNNVTLSDSIKDNIYTIRGLQVMLDKDLAKLYAVKTKRLNEQVKRNIERFPSDFMFQLTEEEAKFMVSQNATPSMQHLGGHLPYVFTEHGIATLSGVLKSKRAIEVNIQIMRAFVAMRRFISANAGLFQRIDKAEQKLLEHDDKFSQVFNLIEDKGIKPEKGIFYSGQIFDAYRFVSDLVKGAKKSIVLIDNYIDDTVLTLFSKREKGVNVIILTKISKQLKLDLKKHNSQYPEIIVKEFKESHDRFLVVDDEVYHFGASLKDLGKKWFAFSKFEHGFRFLEMIENEM
jgi:hypothetical protein